MLGDSGRADRRQARADRARARARQQSQPGPATLLRLRRPAERRGHQASTAHVQAAYPAVAEAGLGSQGVYIGRDAYGGSFVFDPWVLYTKGLLTSANTLVLGSPGYGKSALSKAYAWRQRVFGRLTEFVDPKGEYGPLVDAMGGVTLELAPGGDVALNPLTRVGTREMREGLLQSITSAMLDRPLSQAEAVGLGSALAAADVHRGDAETCVPDVVAQLRDPGEQIAHSLNMTLAEARDELREISLALHRLSDGPLRGMFDRPTSVGESAWDAPAVCLDLSSIGVGVSSSDLALGITMTCASAFLDAKRLQRARDAERAGRAAPKVIRTNDELWRAFASGLGEYYQAAFKLARDSGVQHWLVLHRLSDLRAAGDEGSRQQRLAEGLLADASTVICYRQQEGEVPNTAQLLGLSSTETNLLASLGQGQALWRVGGRSFLVQHVLSDLEWELVNTDAAMLEPDRSAISHQAEEHVDALEGAVS